MDLFNSWHLIQKQISSFIDLQYPAIDIHHFSNIMHIQWRAATTIKANAVTSLKVNRINRAYKSTFTGSKSDQELSFLDTEDCNFNPYLVQET